MFSKIHDIITCINYIVFTAVLISSAFVGKDILSVMIFYFAFLTSYTISRYFLNEEESNNRIKLLFLILDLSLIFLINYYCGNYLSLVLYLFLIDDVILSFSKKEKYSMIPVIYGVNITSVILQFKGKYDILIILLLVSIPVYIIFCIIFLLIDYLIKQNDVIQKSLREVTLKKLEKDNIYNDLSEAYKKVEVMTASNERNRIAREIHDTVGHTLTTVLVELEACKRLMDKDIELSKEKLSLAQGQVKKGLNDIRNSVKLLEQGEEITDFYSALEALIAECEKHSGIVIRSYIDKKRELADDIKKVVYRALQEGLTNGIRHGGSTAFLFKLSSDADNLYFSLEDNGKGAVVISPGFGIRAMKDRVQELDGTLEISSTEGEGFSIYINIPLLGGQAV